MIIKSIKEITEFIAGDKTRLREVVHPKNDGVDLSYSLAFARLEVGEVSEPHVLHKSSELYIFQQGKGDIFIDGKQTSIAAGDVALVPAGAMQHVVNTGEESLEFHCIVSPPWNEVEEEIV